MASFYKVNFWSVSFYYKDLDSEVQSATIKNNRAESWQAVFAWKQMFTKFEKKLYLFGKLSGFQYSGTKYKII